VLWYKTQVSHARVRRPQIQRYYAWFVVVATFLVILVSAGVRAAPGALLKPLEADFGWSRGSISLAVAVSILFYGFAAPTMCEKKIQP